MTWKETFKRMRLDVQLRRKYEQKNRDAGLLWTLLSPGLQALLVWRLQKFFYARRWDLIGKLLANINMIFYNFEIAPEAQLEGGVLVINPVGMLIHAHTKIARNVTLVHQISITIGPRPGMDPVNDYIVLEENVVISPGCRLIGNLTIGRDSWIGPNTTLTKSVPAQTQVMGIKSEPLLEPVALF